MLDTNALDYIFNNKDILAPDLINSSRKNANFYITGVQRYEIDKITDITKIKSINKILSEIGTKTIFPSTQMINNFNVTSYCNIQSWLEIYEKRMNILDGSFLRKIYEYIPCSKINFADLLILYTAAKNKMDYLITDNISDFRLLLQKLGMILPNILELKKNNILNNLQNIH